MGEGKRETGKRGSGGRTVIQSDRRTVGKTEGGKRETEGVMAERDVESPGATGDLFTRVNLTGSKLPVARELRIESAGAFSHVVTCSDVTWME